MENRPKGPIPGEAWRLQQSFAVCAGMEGVSLGPWASDGVYFCKELFQQISMNDPVSGTYLKK